MNEPQSAHSLTLQAQRSREPSASVEIEQARAIQQVQAAMVVAKKFPRNIDRAMKSISETCEMRAFAEDALYGYKRGQELVSGPSIRAAEVIAQAWGNLDFGLIEVSNYGGQSEVEAFAHDLETNVRRSIRFFVEHARYKKGGVREELHDSRDIYELIANQGQRRVRACILAVIPSFVQADLVARVENRLARDEKGNAKPLSERIAEMVALFATMNVTTAQIERRLGHKVEATSESELVRLRSVVKSIREGFAKVEEFFDPVGVEDLEPTRKPAATTAAPQPSDPAPATGGAAPTIGSGAQGGAKEGAIDEAEVMRSIERAQTLEALANAREMVKEFKGASLARLTKVLTDREAALKSATGGAAPAAPAAKDAPKTTGDDADVRME